MRLFEVLVVRHAKSVMIGNAMHICQVIPYVTLRNRMSRSITMNNEARYEMKRVMSFSFR